MPKRSDSVLRPNFLVIFLGVALGASACGGDDPADNTPTTGTLTVTTSTVGVEQDQDGYTVQVDAGTPQPIGLAGSLESTGILPGDHSVQLSGLASNCSVAENPKAVTVAAGQDATVSFEVTVRSNHGPAPGDLNDHGTLA